MENVTTVIRQIFIGYIDGNNQVQANNGPFETKGIPCSSDTIVSLILIIVGNSNWNFESKSSNETLNKATTQKQTISITLTYTTIAITTAIESTYPLRTSTSSFSISTFDGSSTVENKTSPMNFSTTSTTSSGMKCSGKEKNIYFI